MSHVRLKLPAPRDGSVFRVEVTHERPFLPHRHAELELNLILQGHGAYWLDNTRVDLERHSLVWLFPRQNHGLVDCSPDFAMWVVLFRRRLLTAHCRKPETAPLLKRHPRSTLCRRLQSLPARELHSLFLQLSRQNEDETDRFNAGLAYGLLSAWNAYQEAEAIVGEPLHPAVEKAAALLQIDQDAADLTGLARQVGLSPARLSRLFKAQMGQPLSRFRNRQRLDRFFALRAATGRQQNLLALALAAGFGSYAQFHRVCRQELGVGPREL